MTNAHTNKVIPKWQYNENTWKQIAYTATHGKNINEINTLIDIIVKVEIKGDYMDFFNEKYNKNCDFIQEIIDEFADKEGDLVINITFEIYDIYYVEQGIDHINTELHNKYLLANKEIYFKGNLKMFRIPNFLKIKNIAMNHIPEFNSLLNDAITANDYDLVQKCKAIVEPQKYEGDLEFIVPITINFNHDWKLIACINGTFSRSGFLYKPSFEEFQNDYPDIDKFTNPVIINVINVQGGHGRYYIDWELYEFSQSENPRFCFAESYEISESKEHNIVEYIEVYHKECCICGKQEKYNCKNMLINCNCPHDYHKDCLDALEESNHSDQENCVKCNERLMFHDHIGFKRIMTKP
jgi:hypothetical protein